MVTETRIPYLSVKLPADFPGDKVPELRDAIKQQVGDQFKFIAFVRSVTGSDEIEYEAREITARILK